MSMIHIVRSPVTTQHMVDMLEAFGEYVKLAVDVRRGILAGGGMMHADCEATLLEDGSCQQDVWGADWVPSTKTVTFESLINIRPKQNNRSLDILDPAIQDRVRVVVLRLLGGI